jgi:hypothetical protein
VLIEFAAGFMDELAAEYEDRQVDAMWDNLNIHHDAPSGPGTGFNRRHGSAAVQLDIPWLVRR